MKNNNLVIWLSVNKKILLYSAIISLFISLFILKAKNEIYEASGHLYIGTFNSQLLQDPNTVKIILNKNLKNLSQSECILEDKYINNSESHLNMKVLNDIILISYVTNNPDRAQKCLNHLVDILIASHEQKLNQFKEIYQIKLQAIENQSKRLDTLIEKLSKIDNDNLDLIFEKKNILDEKRANISYTMVNTRNTTLLGPISLEKTKYFNPITILSTTLLFIILTLGISYFVIYVKNVYIK